MKNNIKDSQEYGKHIVQYSPQYSLCAGCTSCEVICSMVHDGVISPSYNRIFLQRGGTRDMVCRIASCQHCLEHPCYEKCPKKDSAMCIDENNIVYINEESCIGCGLCIKACKFNPPRINMAKNKDRKRWKAKKCNLCRTRAEGPACVEYCPVRCLGISKEIGNAIKDPTVPGQVSLSQ
jgi:Fe-S-cluster-containing dehydrogenase component